MDEFPGSGGKVKLVVVVAVLLGMGMLGVAVWKAVGGAGGSGSTGSTSASTDDGVEGWCTLRQEWNKAVGGMGADIVLKIAGDDDDGRRDLERKRNGTCSEYAQKLQGMKSALSNPSIYKVEEALVKEGKARANTAVIIGNLLNKLAEADAPEGRATNSVAGRQKILLDSKKELEVGLKERIESKKGEADTEVAAALKPLNCTRIFRGPMTDAGTSDNPYTTWQELDFRRKQAIKRFDEKLEDIEPEVAYYEHVYRKMVSSYGKDLRTCYRKRKKKRPDISSVMGIRVRIQNNGKVRSLALEYMNVPDEKLIDCLLSGATRWKFPKPLRGGDKVVVEVDFDKL